MKELDNPARGGALGDLLHRKKALREFYKGVYSGFASRLASCPQSGAALELGSGSGFLKEFIPDVVTSDVLPYPGVDCVIDAASLPFPDKGLRAIFMLNVFHHLPAVESFLLEAQRCLVPGGRIIMVDQYPGWISTPIFRYAHHEPFNPRAREWSFESSGPLSGANGALAWMVFERDKARLEALVPDLRLDRYRPFAPLGYWLAGGLKRWTLLPGGTYRAVNRLDELLVRISPRFGSFVEIDLIKTGGRP